METWLKEYLRTYVSDIELLCENLINKLHMSNKNDLLMDRYLNSRWCYEEDHIKFLLHGVGCSAESNRFFYDWDFGYGSRWCGINPFLVEQTMRRSGIDKYGWEELQEQCENAVKEKFMYKKYGLYYFEIPREQLIIPEFPKEYDTLVIKYFEKEYVINRCKLVERFIRKSDKIYKKIGDYRDKYILNFWLKENKVGEVYYSDIGYPENAVKLMNSILKECDGMKSN